MALDARARCSGSLLSTAWGGETYWKSGASAGAVNYRVPADHAFCIAMHQHPELSRAAVVGLYTRLLEAWNSRDAHAFAAQFAEDGSTVGFDGSQIDGRAAIATELERIFGDHTPATYVARVREVRVLGDGAALLRAVAGLVPPGQSSIKPERNAIQSLVAVAEAGAARIALYQNTPAQFHGRPELTERLTAELNDVVRSGRIVDGG
jgi:uncharacterized protein (TIGR02246 family)